jgi:peptidoglycan hydrolase CwlO-like protein
MKKAKKLKANKEPTLTSVMGAVQELTEAVQTGFAKVDDKFDNVDMQFDEVKYRITALEKRTGSLENSVEDMKDTLNGVARAVDKDALVIMNHERRIRHLEKERV